jgi:hypothetical protein
MGKSWGAMADDGLWRRLMDGRRGGLFPEEFRLQGRQRPSAAAERKGEQLTPNRQMREGSQVGEVQLTGYGFRKAKSILLSTRKIQKDLCEGQCGKCK